MATIICAIATFHGISQRLQLNYVTFVSIMILYWFILVKDGKMYSLSGLYFTRGSTIYSDGCEMHMTAKYCFWAHCTGAFRYRTCFKIFSYLMKQCCIFSQWCHFLYSTEIFMSSCKCTTYCLDRNSRHTNNSCKVRSVYQSIFEYILTTMIVPFLVTRAITVNFDTPSRLPRS